MPNKLAEETERILLALYKDDMELARQLFPKPTGYTRVFREVIRRYMNEQRKRLKTLITEGDPNSNGTE